MSGGGEKEGGFSERVCCAVGFTHSPPLMTPLHPQLRSPPGMVGDTEPSLRGTS